MRRLVLAAATAALAAWCVVAPARAEGTRLLLATDVYSDSRGTALKEPEGIAVAAGRIFVADTGHGRIVQYVLEPDRIAASGEVAVPELPYPVRVAAGAKGTLFVLDGKLRRIGRLAANGTFGGYVELPGPAVPRALTVDRTDRLWVLDIATGRVLVLDPGGKLEREVTLPLRPRSFYSDIAVDVRGNAFILDSVGRQVLVLKPRANAVETFGPSLAEELDFGTSLAVDAAGRVFVADQNGSGIVVLGSDGSFRGRQSGLGWNAGQLRYPSAIAIDGNRVFVADRGNNRVQVFTIVQ